MLNGTQAKIIKIFLNYRCVYWGPGQFKLLFKNYITFQKMRLKEKAKTQVSKLPGQRFSTVSWSRKTIHIGFIFLMIYEFNILTS